MPEGERIERLMRCYRMSSLRSTRRKPKRNLSNELHFFTTRAGCRSIEEGYVALRLVAKDIRWYYEDVRKEVVNTHTGRALEVLEAIRVNHPTADESDPITRLTKPEDCLERYRIAWAAIRDGINNNTWTGLPELPYDKPQRPYALFNLTRGPDGKPEAEVRRIVAHAVRLAYGPEGYKYARKRAARADRHAPSTLPNALVDEICESTGEGRTTVRDILNRASFVMPVGLSNIIR